MSMPSQLSVSIEKTGLKKHLNETKAIHNNQGYDQFVFYLTPELKLGYTAIGRLMNVDRNTARKWANIYHKEQQNDN